MRFWRAVAIAVGLLLAGGLDPASAQVPGGKLTAKQQAKQAKLKAKQLKQAKQAAVASSSQMTS